MEKGSDTVLPYLGLEAFSDHPEPQGSSGRDILISEAPATKESTSQSEEISRNISHSTFPVGSPHSQSPEETLEPDDLRHEIMHIEGLLKEHHSRVGYLFLCIFTHLIHYTPRCQAYPGNQRSRSLQEVLLVFKALEILSMNTFDYIPMVPHKSVALYLYLCVSSKQLILLYREQVLCLSLRRLLRSGSCIEDHLYPECTKPTGTVCWNYWIIFLHQYPLPLQSNLA